MHSVWVRVLVRAAGAVAGRGAAGPDGAHVSRISLPAQTNALSTSEGRSRAGAAGAVAGCGAAGPAAVRVPAAHPARLCRAHRVLRLQEGARSRTLMWGVAKWCDLSPRYAFAHLICDAGLLWKRSAACCLDSPHCLPPVPALKQ